LLLGSTRFPETVEVHVTSGTSFELSVSDATSLETLPLAQNGWTLAEGVPALYAVLERAAATARTMPGRVAAQFHLTTKSMPRSPEAERMALHRSAVFRR
jgi:putative restriction endonuclease